MSSRAHPGSLAELTGPGGGALGVMLPELADRLPLYEALLQRDPDQGGWDYWAGRVVTDGDIALAVNLASSSEYFNLAHGRFP